MAFEIIKRLFAMKATIHGLTGSRRKLADKLCMMRVAMGALHGFFPEHIRGAELLLWIGRRNTECFQLLFAFFCHPVGSPGRRKLLLNSNVPVTFFDQL